MTTEISSLNPGRAIHGYDLLDQIQETYIPDRAEAHAAIHAMLGQIIEIDGDDVILDTTPINPELLTFNPNDRDIYHWLTISDETAEFIREAIAASYETS
jgi:hypothetical protein